MLLGAAVSQIGPETQALAVHLIKDWGFTQGKLTRFFQATFGISLSRGGSAQIMLRAAERCEDTYRSILLVVRKSTVVYPDETGWKVGGLLQELWTFVTEAATAYLIRPSHGFEVPEEVLRADHLQDLDDLHRPEWNHRADPAARRRAHGTSKCPSLAPCLAIEPLRPSCPSGDPAGDPAEWYIPSQPDRFCQGESFAGWLADPSAVSNQTLR